MAVTQLQVLTWHDRSTSSGLQPPARARASREPATRLLGTHADNREEDTGEEDLPALPLEHYCSMWEAMLALL